MILVPMLVGGNWSLVLAKPLFGRAGHACGMGDVLKLLLQALVYGSISMFAITQLIAIPMIAAKTSFTLFFRVVEVGCGIAALAGFVCWIRLVFKYVGLGNGVSEAWKRRNAGDGRGRMAVLVLAVVLVVLVGLQGRITAKYQHSDDDDSRFVALELLALNHDVMLTRNPINNYDWNWNVGEVKKDYTSPWVMYVAVISRFTGLHPAILSHRMLPMFLVPLCYMAYVLLGLQLFKGDWGRTIVFVLLLTVVNLSGYTSTHTLASMLLLRIWQGKALYAGLIIPVELTLLWNIYDNPGRTIDKWLLALTCQGASLLSGSGIVISAMMVGIYGLMELVRHRSIKCAASIWAACIPCVVYALCNVFWYPVFMQIL